MFLPIQIRGNIIKKQFKNNELFNL